MEARGAGGSVCRARDARPSKGVVMRSRKTIAAIATLACVAGASAAIPSAASAATETCGARCLSVFSSVLGTYADPNYVEAVLDGGTAAVGQPVGLKPSSDSDPSLDIIPIPNT